MQNVHGSDGEPGNVDKSKPWWLTIVRNLLRRSMLLSTNTTNQKDFRAVQEVKAKNGVGPDETLPSLALTPDKEYRILSECPLDLQKMLRDSQLHQTEEFMDSSTVRPARIFFHWTAENTCIFLLQTQLCWSSAVKVSYTRHCGRPRSVSC